MDNTTNEKPKEVYDIPSNVSAYDFFSQSGFNLIRDGDYDTFIVGGVGYRFLIPAKQENEIA